MWELDIGLEVWGLVFSLALGIASALLYDIFRAIHKRFKCKSFFIFLLDILYWLILTLAFFIFFIVFTNGQVRVYAFFGALSGFILSRLTVSRIWFIILLKILSVFKFLMGKIAALLSLLGGIFLKILKNFKKTLKKAFLKRKKA